MKIQEEKKENSRKTHSRSEHYITKAVRLWDKWIKMPFVKHKVNSCSQRELISNPSPWQSERTNTIITLYSWIRVIMIGRSTSPCPIPSFLSQWKPLMSASLPKPDTWESSFIHPGTMAHPRLNFLHTPWLGEARWQVLVHETWLVHVTSEL